MNYEIEITNSENQDAYVAVVNYLNSAGGFEEDDVIGYLRVINDTTVEDTGGTRFVVGHENVANGVIHWRWIDGRPEYYANC